MHAKDRRPEGRPYLRQLIPVVAAVITVQICTTVIVTVTPTPIVVIIVVTMTRADINATGADIYADARRSGLRHGRHAHEG